MSRLPHPSPLSGTTYSAVELLPDDSGVVLLDQRRLPLHEDYLVLRTADDVAEAIRDMVVRGAPAIGIAAAYGLVLAADERTEFVHAAKVLRAARPTAVNLAWAVDRTLAFGTRFGDAERRAAVAEFARTIHRDDVANNRALGALGAQRLPDEAVVLTHCNAGALATGGYGTALGVIRAAHEAGKRIRVLADETRPFLQGSRLTAWELMKDGIPVELVADSSAGYWMAAGAVNAVIVGADRVAQNGDVANKIGTYSLACVASLHDCPFFVAAPWSTVDLQCPSGKDIPIEQRSAAELTDWAAARVAAPGVTALNPAFDVTPARLVRAIFTERGAVEPVGAQRLAELAQNPVA